MNARRVVLRVVAVAVSLALLAWLLHDARWQGVGDRLRGLEVPSLCGVVLLLLTSYALRGARIHGEFRDEIADPGARGYARILRLSLVHNALVNVLPFRSGEAAFPVLLGRCGIATGRAVVSLLWLRAQDAVVVAVLAALLWPGVEIGWRALAIAAIVAGAWVVPRCARTRATRGGRFGPLLERATRRSTAGWAWTIGNWTVKLAAETWLVALALGMRPDAAAALGAIGAELAAILPVQGVAGFGTFEAGGAALMRTQGIALQTGLEAVLVLHAVVLATALVAGALAAALLPGPPANR